MGLRCGNAFGYRNTYSIAISFYILIQGRGASPLNPGLGKRNPYRVAAADGWPLPSPPQGAGVPTCCVLVCLNGSLPLGKAGMGLLCWLVRTPGNSDGVAAAYGWHLPGPLQG